MQLAKAIGWNDMHFGRDAWVVRGNIVLDRGPNPPHGNGRFGSLEPQSKFAVISCDLTNVGSAALSAIAKCLWPPCCYLLLSNVFDVFSGIMYLMKHLIYTICSSHRNDHRTSSIDCDLHKLMNTILCQLKNYLLSYSPLIIINFILSGVLAILHFIWHFM